MSIKIDNIDCSALECIYNLHYSCYSELHNITPQHFFGNNCKCKKRINVTFNNKMKMVLKHEI
jgi:hypothetical protein